MSTKGRSKAQQKSLVHKPVSGKVMYRKEKQAAGWNLDQIKTRWRALPFESKKFWEIKGRGGRQINRKTATQAFIKIRKVLKQGSDGGQRINPPLKWMNSSMKYSENK